MQVCGSEEEMQPKMCADGDREQCLVWGDSECDRNPAPVMKSCPSM